MSGGLVLTAMPEEAHLLGSGLERVDAPGAPAVDRFEGVVAGTRVRLVVSGIGKVAATLALQHALDAGRPDWLLVVGVAGAAAPGVAQGTLVVPERAVQWDLDARPFVDRPGLVPGMATDSMAADPGLRSVAITAAAGDTPVLGGAVLTGDRVVSSTDQRQALLERYPDAGCVDMETAAVAYAALANRVPWVAIRLISDAADHTLDAGAVLDYTAEVAAPRLAALVGSFVGALETFSGSPGPG